MVPPAFRFVGPVESRTEQDSEAVEPLSAGGSGGLVMRLNSGVPAVAGGDRVSSGPRLTALGGFALKFGPGLGWGAA